LEFSSSLEPEEPELEEDLGGRLMVTLSLSLVGMGDHNNIITMKIKDELSMS
jgi:hypothetical protein